MKYLKKIKKFLESNSEDEDIEDIKDIMLEAIHSDTTPLEMPELSGTFERESIFGMVCIKTNGEETLVGESMIRLDKEWYRNEKLNNLGI